MSKIPLGRLVDLQTAKATAEPGFKIGLEDIESGTTRLRKVSSDYAGDGVAFAAGDILFGKLRPYLAKVWRAQRPGAAVGDFHVYRPRADLASSRYLTYALVADSFLGPVVSSVYGAKMPRASWDFTRTVEVEVPGLDTQEAIADYLDRETAQIDTLIAKQEQLIATLRERRSELRESQLSRHVGRGKRLKWALTEVDERAGALADELPLLSVSISWGVRQRDTTDQDESRASDFSSYKCVRAGQLVINRMRAFQGALGVAPYDGIASPDYAVLDPATEIDADWLASTMKTRAFVGEMTSRLKGIGTTEGGNVRTPRINVDDLLQIRLHLPTREEQLAEFAHVDNASSNIDTLIAKAERFIELSKERRAALITAAVTGQIEIPAG